MPGETISVGIIDESRLLREALAELLGSLPDVRVVAAPGLDTELLAASGVNVLLLDVDAGDHDTVHVASRIKSELPDVHVVVTGIVPAAKEIVELVNVGVSGFVLRDTGFDALVGTVRAVAAGEKVLPPRMTELLFTEIAMHRGAPRRDFASQPRLTRREHEVIDLIGEGFSNKAIAARLNITTNTAKSHVRQVMEKLNVNTRLQIAAFVHREQTDGHGGAAHRHASPVSTARMTCFY